MASHSEQTESNYRALQELHRELGTSHFNVLAFPCGQFGDTETMNSRDIEAFAKSSYGVTFPFFSRIKIMGSEAEPAFRFLTGDELALHFVALFWLQQNKRLSSALQTYNRCVVLQSLMVTTKFGFNYFTRWYDSKTY